ncbi:MAG: hypothetical protein LC685_05890, partial [Actinobacteria bacterium]|nr:hypothetical protein [Actinomycetota bacterium]
VATLALAIAISGAALPAATAAAAESAVAGPATVQATCASTGGPGGAAGLVAAVVQAAVNACDVQILNNSVNNLLRNADIHALENILNNSPILSQNDITVQNIDVNVLTGTTTISVLSGGLPVTINLIP